MDVLLFPSHMVAEFLTYWTTFAIFSRHWLPNVQKVQKMALFSTAIAYFSFGFFCPNDRGKSGSSLGRTLFTNGHVRLKYQQIWLKCEDKICTILSIKPVWKCMSIKPVWKCNSNGKCVSSIWKYIFVFTYCFPLAKRRVTVRSSVGKVWEPIAWFPLNVVNWCRPAIRRSTITHDRWGSIIQYSGMAIAP